MDPHEGVGMTGALVRMGWVLAAARMDWAQHLAHMGSALVVHSRMLGTEHSHRYSGHVGPHLPALRVSYEQRLTEGDLPLGNATFCLLSVCFSGYMRLRS